VTFVDCMTARYRDCRGGELERYSDPKDLAARGCIYIYLSASICVYICMITYEMTYTFQLLAFLLTIYTYRYTHNSFCVHTSTHLYTYISTMHMPTYTYLHILTHHIPGCSVSIARPSSILVQISNLDKLPHQFLGLRGFDAF